MQKGLVDPQFVGSELVGGGSSCGDSDSRGTTVESDADGWIDLGTHVERGRHGYEIWGSAYFIDGRNEVDLRANDSVTENSAFVGVAAPIDALVAHVAVDAATIDRTSWKVDAHCRAVRFPWTPPADAWRTVPVHVKVVAPGFEPLEFDWTAATADAPHALVAKSSK